MLEKLQIKNLGLISNAEIDLAPGLVVVTGETGAGKSLLFDAVRALAGAKPKLFNENGDALVLGELKVSNPELTESLENLDADVEDGYITIYRSFPLEGRAKSTLGGRPVPAGVLSEIAENWLVVHGQHDSHRLLVPATHRIILDRYGGMELWRKLAEHSDNFKQMRKLQADLSAAKKKQAELLQKADALRADLALFQSLNVQIGEEDEIAAKIERLSRVEDIRASIERAVEALSLEEMPAALQAAEKALQTGLPTDAEALDLAARLNALRIELADISRSVSAIAEGLDVDPQEIDNLMLRSKQLRTLLLRHGPNTADLINWAAVTELELQLIDPDSPAIKALETAVEQAIKVATKSAAELSELRKSAAVQLAEHVSVELKSLALPHAIFDVDIQPADLSDVGADKVEFRFSANPGLSLAPIANAASGGELSRLMLALEVALVEKSEGFGPSVMLFDEVDAGVAGQAAISVAERLAKLARHRQVLVVSHLPQLAAYADLHITVSKDSNGMVTESFIKGLDETDRSSELARMLAGVAESSSALEHAAELLEMAQSWKRSLND